MADQERNLTKGQAHFPDFYGDSAGFFAAVHNYIDSAYFPGRLKNPLRALNKLSYDCKNNGMFEEEAKLLAAKSEALLKLAQLRAAGRFVLIGSYPYFDKKKNRVRQSVVFVIKLKGEYYSTEVPREKLGSEFNPFLEELDELPNEVKRRRVEMDGNIPFLLK